MGVQRCQGGVVKVDRLDKRGLEVIKARQCSRKEE